MDIGAFTYSGENHPLIDNIKTETFVNGIRDNNIKLAQKTTFAQTLPKRQLAQSKTSS